MKYLIWSFQHNKWWAAKERGYTGDFILAGRYTKERAGEIVTSSILCEEVAVIEQLARSWGPPRADPYGHMR